MLVSVIVCTYNRVDLLEGALQSLAEQTVDKSDYEVIVVDNNSSDNTEEVARRFVERYPNFRYVQEPEQGLSHARNRGYREARTDYVGYTDDDIKADPEWINHAIRVIEDIKPDVFGGPYYPFYIGEKPEWVMDEFIVSKDSSRFLRNNEFLDGPNVFFRKQLLEELGGFNPQLGMKGSNISYGEETELIIKARKVNAKVYYCHEMKVLHLVPEYKLNVFWFLVSAFENGRSLDKTFHVPEDSDRGELIPNLMTELYATFDEIRKGVFRVDETKNLERRILDNVRPVVLQLGWAYERVAAAFREQTGSDFDDAIDLIYRKRMHIKAMEERIADFENSLGYKVCRLIAVPLRWFTRLKNNKKSQ